MPYRPKRPCSYPGCPKLTDGRYCEEHQKIITAHHNKHKRDPASRQQYGRAWKRICDRYITAHPLCEECWKAGKVTPAEEVHHIKPLSRGGTHAEENLMASASRAIPKSRRGRAADGNAAGEGQGGAKSHCVAPRVAGGGIAQKIALSSGGYSPGTFRGGGGAPWRTATVAHGSARDRSIGG